MKEKRILKRILKGKIDIMKNTDRLLIEKLGIQKVVLDLISESEKKVSTYFEELEDIKEYNQYKVLSALQKCRVQDSHFAWNTGYGYNDAGRDTVENVYSEIFGTEASLVRPIIVNGTHALTLTLAGIMRPDEKLIYCTGKPYDSLEEVIGIRGEGKGSLKEFGVLYDQVELTDQGKIDFDELKKRITPDTKMVCAQRATGYAWRRSITMEEIKEWVSFIKRINPEIICMVDNCYGEFLDISEPTDVGADVMAGSLIKNPGGGIALTGGYITGRKDLIELISYRMTSPGIGGECGLMFGQTRSILQGLFLAPGIVNGALKGAILCSQVFSDLGFEVCPDPGEARSDIIQAIKLKSADALIAFCQGIQKAAPVDSFVTPLPWEMPGYSDDVIMAAGAFVQGSSIELSADGPLREPYNVYFQGGLSYEYSKIGVIRALQALYEKQIVKF